MYCIAASVAILLITWEGVFITGSTGARCPSACCKMIQAVTGRVTALEEADPSPAPSAPPENEWELVFSAKAGGKMDILESWKTADDINPNDPEAEIFKSPLAEEWGLRAVDQVRIELTNNTEVKAYYLFDGRRTDKMTFFDVDNILASSHGNLKEKPMKYGFILQLPYYKVSFMISGDREDLCTGQLAWLVVVSDPRTGRPPCEWMKRATGSYFLYCEGEASCNLDDAPLADTFRILYKFA